MYGGSTPICGRKCLRTITTVGQENKYPYTSNRSNDYPRCSVHNRLNVKLSKAFCHGAVDSQTSAVAPATILWHEDAQATLSVCQKRLSFSACVDEDGSATVEQRKLRSCCGVTGFRCEWKALTCLRATTLQPKVHR